MVLIVGLGNPGRKYQETRHNIGFQVVDELRSSLHFATARVVDEFAKTTTRPPRRGVPASRETLASRPSRVKRGPLNNFPKFKLLKKFKAEISQGKIANQKIILAKPQTFMNLSGKSVKKLISNIQHPTSNIWIVHDDIDLPLGKIRISVGRGAAGHKGVQSIIDELGTKNFVRFRIGIKSKTELPFMEAKVKKRTKSSSPIKEQKTKNNIENFVLEKFSKNEEKVLKRVIKKTIEAIECSLKLGLEKTMQKFNKPGSENLTAFGI